MKFCRILRQFRRNSGGNAIVEVALLMPWIVFLFVGILDAGFYAFNLITTENAARVGALQASLSAAASTDSGSACVSVLQEMSALPNVSGLISCGAGTVSSTLPVSVVATSVDHGGGDVSTVVTVMYLTTPMVAIPGIFPAQMTITRSAEVPLAS